MSGAASRRLLTLGAWLAFASSALTVLLTLLLTLVIERTASAGVAGSIGSSLAELASQTANRLDRGIFERYREIQLMSARLAGLNNWKEVQAELDAARNTYRFYAWLGVADEKGVVRAASGGLLNGADVSQRPWFQRARQGTHLGDVHEAVLLAKLLEPSPTGEPRRFYDVAFPLRGGGGGSGVLGAHIDWEWATDVREVVFGGTHRNEGIEPLIVSSDDVVLLGPKDVQGRKLQLASLQRAGQGQVGFVTERWPDGETYLVGHAASRGFLTAPGLGWRVLVRQDEDAAYQPLRRIQHRVVGWGVALAVLFSVLGWLAARAVTRPLLELADVARRLEQGDAVEVQPSSAYREVQVLGATLNAMLARLRGKRQELTTLNAELEGRVEQRTAELRDAFDRVRANEQRVQTIIETAQDPFFAVDLEGHIIEWNTQAEVVFGWGREEVLGRRASELLLPPRFAASLEGALAQFVATGRADALGRPLERVMVTRDGREFPVEVKLGLVSTGNERFFTAFVHDISQRKEVERLKDEFVSTVSHELRTPLTAIYGSLNLLASGMAGELPPDAQQLLKISHESTERLIRLINDMLDLEKIASGKIEYRMLTQPLRPLVEQAIRDTRAYAEGLRVAFVLATGPEVQVHADSDRIVQVCVNLLSNAAKFSPADGEVEVAVTPRSGWVRVSVTDHGAGVPPEFRDRMFQRFAQADASDRRTKGGTGLGLSISRSIVEAHGGRIDFESEPGVRTEFFFELPRQQAVPAGAGVPAVPPAGMA